MLKKHMTIPQSDTGFVAGTPVWTDRGLIPIESIKIGDMILSRSGVAGESSYKPVVNAFVKKQQNIIVNTVYTMREVDGKEKLMRDYIFSSDSYSVWMVARGWVPVLSADQGELALQDDTASYMAGISMVFEDVRTENTGIIVLDQGEQLCVPVMFDGAVSFFDGAEEGIRFNGGSARFTGVDQVLGQDGMSDKLSSRIDVYGIEIEDFNSYFVGAIGLWVHNLRAA